MFTLTPQAPLSPAEQALAAIVADTWRDLRDGTITAAEARAAMRGVRERVGDDRIDAIKAGAIARDR